MLPDRVSNPGPLTYESGALPIALRGPAHMMQKSLLKWIDIWGMYIMWLTTLTQVRHFDLTNKYFARELISTIYWLMSDMVARIKQILSSSRIKLMSSIRFLNDKNQTYF